MLTYRRGVLTEGWFSGPGRSGMMLSDGYFWARRDGGYNFYLSDNGVSGFDFRHPFAACGSARTEFTPGGQYEQERDYWLAVSTVSRFGLESSDYAWMRIRTDSDVNGAQVPGQVDNLHQGLNWNGEVTLSWEYNPRPGWPAVSNFVVYWTCARDAIDYSDPADEIAFRPGQRLYTWDGPGFTNDDPLRLAVRAVSADGIHDGSLRYIIGRGDPDFPGTIAGQIVEQV